MEYEGRLFGKVGKSYIPLTNVTGDFTMLENRVRELEAENLELRKSSNSHIHVVMQTLPFSFVEWYSGMQKEKIESAYKRWMKEGNVAVGQRSVGQNGRVGCCGKGGLIDGTFFCDRGDCIHKISGEAPSEGVLH